MKIMKGARGLPRFMADCGFWRHPRWRGSDRLAEMGLFTACLSYCYEHETDGVVPGPDADDMAAALGLRVSEVTPVFPLLLERGSLVRRPDGDFELVGFSEHNPTRDEIHEYREHRSEIGKKAAAARWNADEADEMPAPMREPDASCIPPMHASSYAKERSGAERSGEEELKPSAELALVVADPPSVDPVEQVFTVWQEATGHHKAVLDKKRRRVVVEALKHYPPGDLEDACRGVLMVPHNRGETNGQRYDELTLVLRDSAHIEKFRDRYRSGPGPPPGLGGLAAFVASELTPNGQEVVDVP